MNTQETLSRCRICNRIPAQKYTMRSPEGTDLVYFFCRCGVIYHDRPVDQKRFTPGYLAKIREAKFFQDRIDYPRRVYMPIIEEATYGRESLDVGFGFPENILNMRDRGWLSDGIDLIKNDYITGDFEKFEFKDMYDLVILHHVVGSFSDPEKAIEKAAALVKPGGVVFVMAPDAGSAIETGFKDFGHWGIENRTMYSLENMKNSFFKNGFEREPLAQVVNLSPRFLYKNDFHLIMRKGLK